MSSNFADIVANACYKQYNSLPKTGKPQRKNEWTLLAAITMTYDDSMKKMKILSLSTGTKCLGYSQLSEKGDVVFDSHAEVLARRAFIRYLYQQMAFLLEGNESEVLYLDTTRSKFLVKPGLKFHLFITNVPCGDAAIFSKQVSGKHSLSEHYDEPKEKVIKKMKTEHCENDNKISDVLEVSPLTSDDIYRTGAKCVESEAPDPKKPGSEYHITGVLRTKPGRGDPTWSMSCSDKIALWNVCGLQGALLSLLLAAPIYLDSLIFGKCPFDEGAIKRAVICRLSAVCELPPLYKINKPEILQSSLPFEFGKDSVMKENENVFPCPTAVVWCDILNFHNVCVNGRKQGITKKNICKPSSRIDVCKSVLFEKFLHISSLIPVNLIKCTDATDKTLTYMDYKLMATPYQEAKQSVFKIFNGWKRKPDHLQRFLSIL